MNIEIAFDPYKVDKESDSFTVQTKDDYIKARLYIREYLKTDTIVRLLVKNRGLNGWFKDLDRHASFKNISPLEILKSLLNRSDLPNILTHSPQKLIDLNLINLAYSNPIKPSQSSLDWILSVTISFPWIRENLKEGGDVSQVLEWLVRYKSISIDNLLVQLCIEKIRVWKMKSPFREVLEWLEPDPFERGYLFSLCQILKGYPDPEKAKWLQFNGEWSTICQLSNYTRWLQEIPPANEFVINPSLGIRIKDYIQEKLAKEGLTIEIIKELSGVLKVEEDVLYRYLLNPSVNKSELSTEILHALQDKFGEGDLKDFLLELRSVEPPPILPADCKLEDTITWLEKNYFPYRYWCRTVDKEDLLDSPIRDFEDWFIKKYNDLLSTQPEIFVSSIRKTVYSLIQDGASILLVIVDGLSWKWVDYIVRKIKDYRLYLEKDPEMKFSMVPSVSEVSKPSIISGFNLSDTVGSESLTLSYYTQLFKESYSKYTGEYVVATDSSDTLFTLLQEDSNVYLYLFNEVDNIAHEHGNDTLRDTNIRISLDKLLLNISCALQEYERLHEGRLKVLVAGDHGYLSLPKHFSKISIDDSISCHHGRVALSDNIEGCYSLRISNRDLSLAKGFNVIGKKPRGGVHGGITPDELVVPVIIFSTTPSTPLLKPSLTLDGEVKRHYHDCQFIIEITNPNPNKLHVLGAEIDFMKIYESFPVEILPMSTRKLNGSIDASNIYDAKIKLMYQLKSSCLGQNDNTSGTISLETKGAALVDKAFEEEFDV